MKKTILLTSLALCFYAGTQQVGINAAGNAPDLSAGLDIAFSDKGVLVPRMSVTDRDNISNPANGLIIYNTDCGNLNYYDCDTWRSIVNKFNFPNLSGSNIINVISGKENVSENETGVVYKVPPIDGAAPGGYTWSVPPGATIVSGQGTNKIIVDFTTPGNEYLCVSVINACGEKIQTCLLVDICPLPVVQPIAGNATPSQNQSGVTYNITPVAGANSYNWTVPAGATIVGGQNSTSVTVDFSPTAQNGDICVTATDDCGTSLPQCLTLTMGQCPVPNVPVATTETNLTLSDFDANWSAANGAVDYYFDVATDANFTTFLPGYNNKNVGNNLTDNVTGLSCITDYYYRVRAENVCGATISSNVIQVTINPVPSTPVATAGTNINATDFDANWNASANATSYYIDVSDDAGFSNFLPGYNNQNVGNVTTYNVSGLTCETDYYYRVRAENACGTTISSGIEHVFTGNCCTPSSGSITLNYTGNVQTWTVPCSTTSIQIDVYGAQGGNGSTSTGGLGGRVEATLSVTPNEVLNIYVGGQPSPSNGVGYNGGGSGLGTAGGGGGATDIRRGGNSLSDRIIVAGGGGGGGQGNGGIGGGLIGGQGSTNGNGVWAQGGTQSVGGAGGMYNSGSCSPGAAYAQSGTFGIGGDGLSNSSCCCYGGGGGGGWYGGGGMQINGAGGGSSYTISPGATGVVHTQGNNSGDGYIIITW